MDALLFGVVAVVVAEHGGRREGPLAAAPQVEIELVEERDVDGAELQPLRRVDGEEADGVDGGGPFGRLRELAVLRRGGEASDVGEEGPLGVSRRARWGVRGRDLEELEHGGPTALVLGRGRLGARGEFVEVGARVEEVVRKGHPGVVGVPDALDVRAEPGEPAASGVAQVGRLIGEGERAGEALIPGGGVAEQREGVLAGHGVLGEAGDADEGATTGLGRQLEHGEEVADGGPLEEAREEEDGDVGRFEGLGHLAEVGRASGRSRPAHGAGS